MKTKLNQKKRLTNTTTSTANSIYMHV